jgi:methionine-rich copper-binding protein CopC
MKPLGLRAPARLSLVVALLAASPILGGASLPHLGLVKSTPSDKAAVESVSEIKLWFTEAPMDMGPKTVSLRIVADGKLLAAGDAARDAQDAKVYSLALPRSLAPRAYTVEWQAMAADGDLARGEFGFTVVAPR